MAISTRQVKNKRDSNGVLTGRPGTVYDVNIKYTAPDGKKKSYAKKGFATKKEAAQHEAEMKTKLQNPGQVASHRGNRLSLPMAHEKVDAKLLGFKINDLETKNNGGAETFTLSAPWQIAENGRLPISYDAVVSAVSQPVTEQDVLSIVFVLEWSEG